MLRQRRGLGVLASDSFGRLKAAVKIVDSQAKDIRIGQPASIDTHHDVIPGRVINVGSDNSGGVITVDISLAGDLPQSARAGLEVEGVIEIERLYDVLYVQRPAIGEEGSVSSLFKIEEGGATATRVPVRLGKSSIATIEIVDGLNAGDKVIVSDMPGYGGVNTIRLNP
jgi:HlyD family secretion protein